MRSAARAVLTALLLVGTLIAASACGAGSRAATTTEPATGATPASSPAMAGSSATMPAAGSAALPDVHLPGVNDPNCTSADRPVVLLPGTFSTVAGNFGALAAALQADGRCVYGLNYGLAGVAPVRDPAVGTAVLIAPTFHGSTSDLLTGVPAAGCPACADQTAGSPLLTELNAGGDLDGDVRYATISSRDDTVVTPVEAQSPVGPDDRVRSLIVQDRCPDVRLDHLDLPGDPGVIGWVRQALSTDGRPDPSTYRCR